MSLKVSTDTLTPKLPPLNNSINYKRPIDLDLWNKLLREPTVDSLPVGIALLNDNFVLCNYNRKYEGYLGSYSSFSPKMSLGKDFFTYAQGSYPQIGGLFKHVRDNCDLKAINDFHLKLERREMVLDTFWDMTLAPVRENSGRVSGVLIYVADITEPTLAKRYLDQLETELEEMKSALKTVLKIREENQIMLKQMITTNAAKNVMPFIKNLRKTLSDSQQVAHLDIIESNLKNIISPFSQTMDSIKYALSPREQQIVTLIKRGKTSKEIAEYFRVSLACISFHRHNIRAKLGLKNKKVNLTSFLLSQW